LRESGIESIVCDTSRKPIRKTVSGYSRFRNAQSVVPRLRKEPDELARKMLLIGYLTERLEREKPESVYIVGGQAIETYTAGQFRTGDIDIVTPDSKAAEEILKRIGFERERMIWLNKAPEVGNPHCRTVCQKP
jgi:hypothetical protein